MVNYEPMQRQYALHDPWTVRNYKLLRFSFLCQNQPWPAHSQQVKVSAPHISILKRFKKADAFFTSFKFLWALANP
jgi:hypothetical protein